ncbi:MAG: hypothetical protein H7Z41_05930 [Cytophagales bacterium]|nr:hypothetical protein [Armatimonadota bacterium]
MLPGAPVLSAAAALTLVTLLFRLGYGPLVVAIVPQLPLPSPINSHSQSTTFTQPLFLTPSIVLGLAAAAFLTYRDGAGRTVRRFVNPQTVAGAAFYWLLISRLTHAVLMLSGNHALYANHLWGLQSLMTLGPFLMTVPPAIAGWIVTRVSPKISFELPTFVMAASTAIFAAMASAPNRRQRHETDA